MKMTGVELRRREARYRVATRHSEAAREARNAAVRQAITEGWTHQQISDWTKLTRGRVGQIAQQSEGRDTEPHRTRQGRI